MIYQVVYCQKIHRTLFLFYHKLTEKITVRMSFNKFVHENKLNSFIKIYRIEHIKIVDIRSA